MPRGHRRPSPTGIARRLGQRIRDLREERGIAQAELARRIGSSPSHLNKLEAGLKAATVVTVEAVARALGVEVAELFPASDKRAAGNPPDPLWGRIAADLRVRDREFLQLVRESVRLLERAVAAKGARRGP